MSPQLPTATDDQCSGPVVVIGTARDENGALEEMLRAIADRGSMTFVVVQDPGSPRPCNLPVHLADLAVQHVNGACVLRPGTVHVVPASCDVKLERDGIVAEPWRAAPLQHPIDHVLTLAASEFRERTVAIVLAGVECVTPRGIDAVEYAGGRAIVQSLGGRDLSIDEMAAQVRNHAKLSTRDPVEALRAQVRELRAVQSDLRARNRELERFTTAAAHDLKSPLRSIITLAELALEDLHAGSPQDAREGLERIGTAAWRMSRLISALLLFATVGRSSMAREEVALRDVVDLATEDLAPEIDEADATVLVTSRLPIVTGDPVLLRQLLQNLISNAVKYSAPGREPVVRISARPLGDAVELSVADNGAGIDSKDAERIFLPFQRGGSRDVHGCGIGLTTCRRVVERHDGTITVVSEIGEGAAFLIRLPAARLVGWEED